MQGIFFLGTCVVIHRFLLFCFSLFSFCWLTVSTLPPFLGLIWRLAVWIVIILISQWLLSVLVVYTACTIGSSSFLINTFCMFKNIKFLIWSIPWNLHALGILGPCKKITYRITNRFKHQAMELSFNYPVIQFQLKVKYLVSIFIFGLAFLCN